MNQTATEIYCKFAELYEQLAQLNRQLSQSVKPATDEVAEKSPQQAPSEEQTDQQPKYRIKKAHIGKLALLIKAMYEVGMFVDENGNSASNVEDLAHYIGHALGEDFPNWPQTLRGATLPDSSLSIFDRLRHEGEKYKNKIKKDDC